MDANLSCLLLFLLFAFTMVGQGGKQCLPHYVCKQSNRFSSPSCVFCPVRIYDAQCVYVVEKNKVPCDPGSFVWDRSCQEN